MDPLRLNRIASRVICRRDKFVQASICSTGRNFTALFEMDTSHFATTYPRAAKELVDQGISMTRKYEAASTTIWKLFEDSFGKFSRSTLNSFVSTDVEGAELSAIKGVDFDQFSPGLFLIEIWDGRDNLPQSEKITSLLKKTIIAKCDGSQASFIYGLIKNGGKKISSRNLRR